MIRIAAIGLDHNHGTALVGHLVEAGAALVGWATEGAPRALAAWHGRFDAPRRTEAQILSDPQVDLVVTAAVPGDRAALAQRALAAGKHVLADKPGVLSRAELAAVLATARQANRLWTVGFSERYEVPAMTRASALVRDGAIGEVLDVTLIAPHRLHVAPRPDWFWDRARNGGILTDIGSHQIEQVLHFAGTDTAEILFADAHALRQPPFQDRGRIVMHAGRVTGTILVHWFTPDALPAWGDGRLFVTGTEGSLEVRKYVDPGGAPGGNHVILVDGQRVQRQDASADPLPFFANLLSALRTGDRRLQDHAAAVMALAIDAQTLADTC